MLVLSVHLLWLSTECVCVCVGPCTSSSQYSSVQYTVVHYSNYWLQDSRSACVAEPGASGSCSSAAIGACEWP